MPQPDLPKRSDPLLDVRSVPLWHRLDAILATVDRLALGAAFELIADIDPWPMRQYLKATRRGAFDWQYLESGPQIWRVRVSRTGAGSAA